MFVVIFKAEIAQLDHEYSQLAQHLRQKALSEYGCLKFESYTENGQELALSYWSDLESIQRWQQDCEHIVAQQTGQERWYKHYSVEVCEIQRHYQHHHLK
ncbi:antibiotic biosynthesis monooxygenase [Acinetobacter brisouii]|uniref:antibiotic biosynthesis monooxygenase family protein n=1 Tax=Acinetobacter brisouii TaxID=396323 RepID=UPI0035B0CE5F